MSADTYDRWLSLSNEKAANIRSATASLSNPLSSCHQELVGLLQDLISRAQTSGQPMATPSADSAKAEAFVALFARSLWPFQEMLCTGCYVQASTILKQQFDCLASIKALKLAKYRLGGTPNVANMLGANAGKFMKKLQSVAHLTGQDVAEGAVLAAGKLARFPHFDSQVYNELLEGEIFLILHSLTPIEHALKKAMAVQFSEGERQLAVDLTHAFIKSAQSFHE